MKRNILKISAILLIVIFAFSVISLATGVEQFSGKIGEEAGTSRKAVVKIISTVLNVTRTIGIAVAVIMLIIVACKYIIASAGDRADIKKYAFNYIVGALILFGASGLISIAKSFVDAIKNES